MEIFKKALVCFFTILLMSFVFVLIINTTLKGILVDSIVKENLKVQIIENIKANNSELNVEADELNKVLESEEVSNLLDKYLELTLDGVMGESDLSEADIENDILKFLQDNKSVIEKEVGQEVTDEMIKESMEVVKTKELTNAYKEAIAETSVNLGEPEKGLIKGFDTLTSERLRIILIIASIVCLIIIALLQWSLYKWLKNLSIALITNSICLIITSLIIKEITTKAKVISFETSNMLTTGIVILVVGIISYIVYKVLDIILKKKNKENDGEVNEVSKVVEG